MVFIKPVRQHYQYKLPLAKKPAIVGVKYTVFKFILGQNFSEISEYGELKLYGLYRDSPRALTISNPASVVVKCSRITKWLKTCQ